MKKTSRKNLVLLKVFFRVFGGFIGFYRVSSVFTWFCFSGDFLFWALLKGLLGIMFYFLGGFLSKSKGRILGLCFNEL